MEIIDEYDLKIVFRLKILNGKAVPIRDSNVFITLPLMNTDLSCICLSTPKYLIVLPQSSQSDLEIFYNRVAFRLCMKLDSMGEGVLLTGVLDNMNQMVFQDESDFGPGNKWGNIYL